MIFSTRRARPTPKPSPLLLSATRSTSSPAASPQNKPRSSANRTATSLISRPRSVRPPPTRPPFGSRSLLPVSPLPGADSGLWCRSCPSLCGHGGVIHLCARPMLTVLVSPIRTPPLPLPHHTLATHLQAKESTNVDAAFQMAAKQALGQFRATSTEPSSPSSPFNDPVDLDTAPEPIEEKGCAC